jgi:Fe-S-cluster containining protein
MKRYCSLEEISDGKLYELNDLVEAGCDGCSGEAVCCHGMCKTIILDPYDIYGLTVNLKCTFESLLTDRIELGVVDGVILPNLRMTGLSQSCVFLNRDGRCSIHAFRPGICRIFPLGRYYENHDFKYILQINECIYKANSKIKVMKWIDTAGIKKNERFIIDWHYFLKDVEEIIQNSQDDSQMKNINMYILNNFYVMKYHADKDFYFQFYERINEAKEVLKIKLDNMD